MYKKISFRSVPKPGPGNRAGFFIARTRAPQKRLWFFEAPTPGAPKASVSWPPPPRHPERRTHLIWWDEKESESGVRLRVERMIAQAKAHPDDRFFYVSWRR
jgi:hypothetical protein